MPADGMPSAGQNFIWQVLYLFSTTSRLWTCVYFSAEQGVLSAGHSRSTSENCGGGVGEQIRGFPVFSRRYTDKMRLHLESAWAPLFPVLLLRNDARTRLHNRSGQTDGRRDRADSA